jgi:hypothetical protein
MLALPPGVVEEIRLQSEVDLGEAVQESRRAARARARMRRAWWKHGAPRFHPSRCSPREECIAVTQIRAYPSICTSPIAIASRIARDNIRRASAKRPARICTNRQCRQCQAVLAAQSDPGIDATASTSTVRRPCRSGATPSTR